MITFEEQEEVRRLTFQVGGHVLSTRPFLDRLALNHRWGDILSAISWSAKLRADAYGVGDGEFCDRYLSNLVPAIVIKALLQTCPENILDQILDDRGWGDRLRGFAINKDATSLEAAINDMIRKVPQPQSTEKDSLDALARKVVAHPHFRFRGGERWRFDLPHHQTLWCRYAGGDVCTDEGLPCWESDPRLRGPVVIDLQDPATKGCLLGLLRELYQDPSLTTFPETWGWNVRKLLPWDSKHVDAMVPFQWASEEEVLVACLTAFT